MFFTSLSPKSVNVYCNAQDIDFMKQRNFPSSRNGVYAFVTINQASGVIYLSPTNPGVAQKYCFSKAVQDDLYRMNAGIPKNYDLDISKIGGAWFKYHVDSMVMDDGNVIRLLPPEARLPADYVPTPKLRAPKKPKGPTVLAELPDGSTLVCEGMSYAELMQWQTDMVVRGHKFEVSESIHVVRD